jgi:hypothetical protein
MSPLLLAATGSLNTSIHLTSLQQFLTTLYGRVLAVKIEFFLLMTAISAYHAFSLRPRLAQVLARRKEMEVDATKQARATVSPSGRAHTEGTRRRRVRKARAVKRKSRSRPNNWPSAWKTGSGGKQCWGAIVLLCVALLAVFAGSLAPPI